MTGASRVVEASAGTGKTTRLVQRIVDVIEAGADIERIAAVTFTVAAAGDMKLRIAQKLSSENVRKLERAFVGTIHAFCAHMLRQRPVEACVDPGFEELAEPERVFARVFEPWLRERLAAGSPVLRRAFARLAWRDERRGAKPPVQALQDCAWELMQWRDHPAPWTRRDFDREAGVEALLGSVPLPDFMERLSTARCIGDLDYDTWEAELLAVPREFRWKKGQHEELCRRIAEFKQRADADLAVNLRDELWPLVDRYGSAKRRAGQLDFLDLLVHADKLLQQPGICEYFQRRYEYLFVDEFQDTDPLQTRILQRLAGDREGKLFVVGDPKQSIYRFRRADVSSFNRTCDTFVEGGAVRDQLQKSYRSTKPIQEFVNAAFEPLIPNYLPLEGGREPDSNRPSILALPIPEPYGTMNLSKAAMNKCSPQTVAAFIKWGVDKEWFEPKDVCILFRRFTNDGQDLTQDYVRCLEAQGLPHVLVGSKSFHHREEIAALRTALRAIEWREDKLSEYATLRNFYGITDGTLFQHDLCDRADTRISEARAFLQKLHYGRDKHPIADTINRLLEHCRAFTAFSLRKGGRRVVANVQRLIETARTFELRYATSFRSFVEYLEEQAERGEAADAPILEQESDGVKLMTVHKAKGLEFKVVILADLTAHLTGQGDRYVNGDLCAQRMLGCAPWDLIDNLEREAQADREEGIRVAYVAATRAKDMLVVTAVGDRNFVENHDLFKTSWLAPLYPALYPHMDRWRLPERPVQGLSTIRDDPESLRPGLHRGRVGGCEVWWFDPGRLELKDSADSGLDDTSILQGDPTRGYEAYTAWKDSKQAVIDKASEPAFRLAIASDAAADRSDVDVYRTRPKLTPKGTRLFGKMVHGILQHGLEASHSQMREHGCSEQDRIAAVERVQFALGHEVMAATHIARTVYRELPVMVRLDDGSLVEGRADLAYFDGQRWTVVDFKTGEANAGDRAQVRMYAQALERATGQPVRAVILEI